MKSSFIGMTILHVSGSLSVHHQEFLAVHRLWYILCSCDGRLLPGAGWNCSSILLLVANGHQNCKIYQCPCTAKSWWWWAERLPEACRIVIPTKLEFSASVGFIHKDNNPVFKMSFLMEQLSFKPRVLRLFRIGSFMQLQLHVWWKYLLETSFFGVRGVCWLRYV
jgi:hypothetical protein